MASERALEEKGYEYVYEEGKTVKMKKLIGRGASSAVYLVKNKTDGQIIVCKELRMSELSEPEQKCAKNELDLLTKVNHSSIIRIHDQFVVDDPAAGGEKFMILLEYADGGDVSQQVARRTSLKPFPPETIQKWFAQTVLAVHHLHQRRIVHRDLKTQNLFLKGNDVKLGDLGIAKQFDIGVFSTTTHCGTPQSFSPEVVLGKEYNAKADVWALGVILYELVMLRPPFAAPAMMDLLKSITTCAYEKVPQNLLGGRTRGAADCTGDVIEIIRGCLQVDPDNRVTVNQLLRHPYVAAVVGKGSVPAPRVIQLTAAEKAGAIAFGLGDERDAAAESDGETYSDDGFDSSSGSGSSESFVEHVEGD